MRSNIFEYIYKYNIMTNKTLLGKDNYLFLQNDTNLGLYNHQNLSKIILNINKLKFRYDKYINNMLFIIFPDKEIVCKKFLPNNIKCDFRQYADLYKIYFKNKLIETNSILDYTDYYKTDTHMNNKGAIKVYNKFINYINTLFNVNINILQSSFNKYNVTSLSELNIGIGDLTWDINKGDMELADISDIYYEFNIINYNNFYLNKYSINDNNFLILNKKLEDISKNYIDILIDWKCLSNNFLYKKNINYHINKKVLIFYDSFLTSSLNIYKNIFKEVFFSKTPFNKDIINLIKPDFIIEFRAERFLFA